MGLVSESWGACGQCLVSSPSCPMSGIPSALFLRAQHECPLSTRVPSACRASGPVSMVTRSHFPSPGCSRQLSDGRCRRCPPLMGNRQGWAPLPWGAVLLPFSPRGCAPCPMSPVCPGDTPGRLQYLTLSLRCGDEGCLGHAEAPVTAGLGGGTLVQWPGERSGAGSGNCWDHHRAKGIVPSRLIPVPRCIHGPCLDSEPGHGVGMAMLCYPLTACCSSQPLARHGSLSCSPSQCCLLPFPITCYSR